MGFVFQGTYSFAYHTVPIRLTQEAACSHPIKWGFHMITPCMLWLFCTCQLGCVANIFVKVFRRYLASLKYCNVVPKGLSQGIRQAFPKAGTRFPVPMVCSFWAKLEHWMLDGNTAQSEVFRFHLNPGSADQEAIALQNKDLCLQTHPDCLGLTMGIFILLSETDTPFLDTAWKKWMDEGICFYISTHWLSHIPGKWRR